MAYSCSSVTVAWCEAIAVQEIPDVRGPSVRGVPRWAYLTVGVREVPSHQHRLFLNGSPQENDQWNETAARADTGVDNFVRGTPDSSLKGRLRGHV